MLQAAPRRKVLLCLVLQDHFDIATDAIKQLGLPWPLDAKRLRCNYTSQLSTGHNRRKRPTLKPSLSSTGLASLFSNFDVQFFRQRNQSVSA